MAKKQKKQPEFPELVLVQREQDGDDSYLLATDNMGDVEAGNRVGVYKLAFVRTMEVTRKLV